ncbi:MAG: type I-E CRISPR-associated protein Cas6/Cse3/CasE [Clostridia bacterium]
MYLSRIAINPNRRETMAALALPNKLHGAVENCFTGEKQRNLWRIDWLHGNCYLLILSPQKPDFSHIIEQFGSVQAGESKDYHALLEKVKPAQAWSFRLCANPVHSNTSEKKSPNERGKVYAFVHAQEQKQWLISHAQNCGFALDENGFDTVHTQWLTFSKGSDPKHKITLLRVTFEGILHVTDAEKFRKALVDGIGREKAYGCGLLTIAPKLP